MTFSRHLKCHNMFANLLRNRRWASWETWSASDLIIDKFYLTIILMFNAQNQGGGWTGKKQQHLFRPLLISLPSNKVFFPSFYVILIKLKLGFNFLKQGHSVTWDLQAALKKLAFQLWTSNVGFNGYGTGLFRFFRPLRTHFYKSHKKNSSLSRTSPMVRHDASSGPWLVYI